MKGAQDQGQTITEDQLRRLELLFGILEMCSDPPADGRTRLAKWASGGRATKLRELTTTEGVKATDWLEAKLEGVADEQATG